MIEKLAEEVHKLWMGWAKELIKEEKFSSTRVQRWKSCFVPYKKLSEEMKDKDRKIARDLYKKMLPIKYKDLIKKENDYV